MIIAFDLDDTLYDEIDFVNNGFDSVASYLKKKYGVNKKNTLTFLNKNFLVDRKKKNINLLLSSLNLKVSKNEFKFIINLYRYNKKKNKIKKAEFNLLRKLSTKRPIYLVTDGNPKVQQLKVKKLNIKKYFKNIYYTSLFGKKAHKPSLKVFSHIIKKEKQKFKNLIYVADNPFKDFKNLNKVKATTIRILRGYYCKTKLNKKVSNFNIKKLTDLLNVLKKIEKK